MFSKLWRFCCSKSSLDVILCAFLLICAALASNRASAIGQNHERFRVFDDSAEARALLLNLAQKESLDIYNVIKGQYIEVKASQSVAEQLKKRFTVEAAESEYVSPSLYEGYTSNDGLVQFFNNTVSRWPTKSKYYSIGNSLRGKPIWVLEINSRVGEDVPYPSVKFVANQHGDEVVGRELVLRLATWLLDNYDTDSRAKKIVDGVRLFLVPSMNPDGFESGTRENGARIDLNRNFPDQYRSPEDTPNGRQPETQVIMSWLASHPFVLSANMHGGEICVNYPFDAAPSRVDEYCGTPDDDIFRYISLEYANRNPDMKNHRSFPNGITNGADWYSLWGGMQDYNYIYHGCMETTLELSMNKWPPYRDIDYFWQTNNESMLAYIDTVNHGARGTILDAASGAPLAAQVYVIKQEGETRSQRSFPVRTNPNTGWFFRILTAGEWIINATAPGYLSEVKTISVPARDFVTVHFVLERSPDAPPRPPFANFRTPSNAVTTDVSNASADPYQVALFFSAIIPVSVLIYLRFRK